jgi:broad specificity phosphatase PhoE
MAPGVDFRTLVAPPGRLDSHTGHFFMRPKLIALLACLGGCAAAPGKAAPPPDACAGPGAGPASAVAASDAPRRRIYLVRHGEANYFDAGGQRLADPDTAGLSAKGREQARAVAQWFCSMGVTRFDRVITSDYPRAAQTARGILDTMRLPAMQPQAWPALRELRVADGQHAGESVAAARARILPALEKLRGEQWDTALIVAHTLVDEVILSEALTGSDAAYGRIEQGNGCINILDIGPGAKEWVVRAVNVCPDPAFYWTRESLADRLKK